MPVINPESMYGGARMAALSDLARLHWPWLYLASNGHGRIELNYRKIIRRVYANFSDPISEKTFLALLNEYYSQYLLFIYSQNGQLWGQWETSEKYLPRYKTAEDHASPAPPGDAYNAWRNRYVEYKKQGSITISMGSDNVIEISGHCSNNLCGVGGNDIKPSCSTQELGRTGESTQEASKPQVLDLVPCESTEEKSAQKTQALDRVFQRFWYAYWNHNAKKKAREVFSKAMCRVMDKRRLTAQKAGEFLIARARAQRRFIESGRAPEWLPRLLPTTWLNDDRWEDEYTLPVVVREETGDNA